MQTQHADSSIPFLVAIMVAASLHLGFAAGLGTLLPKHINFMPIQMLQVKLGMEELEDKPAHKLSAPVASAVHQQFSSTKTGGDQLSERAARKLDKAFGKPDAPQQYIRQRTPMPQSTPMPGSELGNSQQTKVERITAYGQTLSLWMQRFKTYSEDARAQGLEGTAVVRIRIDRAGNILYVSFRQRTGEALLDKAVMEMVNRANPVPPVPEDYPVDDPFLEFLIPISFKLGR